MTQFHMETAGIKNFPKATACSCANNGPCDLGSAREKGGAGQPCLWWSQVLFSPSYLELLDGFFIGDSGTDKGAFIHLFSFFRDVPLAATSA